MRSIAFRILPILPLMLMACGPMLVDQTVRDHANMVEVRKRAQLQLDQHTGDYDGRYRRARTKGFRIGPYGKTSAQQEFTFSLAGDDGRAWTGVCQGRARAQDLTLSEDRGNGVTVSSSVELQSSTAASCEIRGGGQTFDLTLEVGTRGKVVGGDEDITLTPVWRYQQRQGIQSGSILGYQLVANDTNLGAVQVRAKRRVWVRNDLAAPRQELAEAIAMALIGLDYVWTSPSDG